MKLISNLLLFFYAITLILFVNDPQLTYIETYTSYVCLAFLLTLKLFKNIPIYFPKFSFVYSIFCIICLVSYLINVTIDTSALTTFIQIQIFLIVILNLLVFTNQYRFLIYGIIAGLLYNIIVANFIGRDELIKWQQKGFSNKFVTLEVHNVTDADALGNNPIYNADKEVVGRATGGNYGFRIGKSYWR